MGDVVAQIQAVVEGDVSAWAALMERYAPVVEQMAARHAGLRSRQQTTADGLAEIVTGTFERLSRADFSNLRRFLQQYAGAVETPMSFDTWLYGAMDYTVREYLRQRYGRAPKASPAGSQRPVLSKRDLGTDARRFATGTEPRDLQFGLHGITTRMTLAEVRQWVAREFAPDEVQAFQMYYMDESSFSDIARALGLPDAKAADRLIRRLNARLRYRFADNT